MNNDEKGDIVDPFKLVYVGEFPLVVQDKQDRLYCIISILCLKF